MSPSPLCRGHEKVLFEASSKCCRTPETTVKSNGRDASPRVRKQPTSSSFKTNSLHKLMERFSHHGRENSVKVKGGEVGNRGQLLQVQRTVQVAFNVVDNPIHASEVFAQVVFGASH